MNRIDKLFQNKNKSVLSVYFTAGYPQLKDTALIISGLEKAGADLIEIGFPFSDPVADGPVIQASSHLALQNGMNLDILFAQLLEIKGSSHIPKILMGYFNTVYQYGVLRFIKKCTECGIDGVIIPDLPPEVYQKEYQSAFESADIHFIYLIAPQTPVERVALISSLSHGFIYRLSSSSTTGSNIRDGLSSLKSGGDVREPGSLPTLIGFGIHDHQTFEMACQRANGAIIGTAFIRYLNENLSVETGDLREQQINELCERFVGDVRREA
jgi:tryptophan synthase alpha chain